jgi:copper chaperone NosL
MMALYFLEKKVACPLYWVVAVLAWCVVGMILLSSAASAQMMPVSPGAKDKCPVCGMFVARYPDWIVVILYKDGTFTFFDGAKDMFKYLFDMPRYAPGRKAADIKTIMAKDYYRLSWIDVRKAWYVIGSDVYGPMGRELIPMEKEADAREFMDDHMGKRILRFDDVTPEMLKNLEK